MKLMKLEIENIGFAKRQAICETHDLQVREDTTWIVNCALEEAALCWPDLVEKKCNAEPAESLGDNAQEYEPYLISLSYRRPMKSGVPVSCDEIFPPPENLTVICRQIGCGSNDNGCVSAEGLYPFGDMTVGDLSSNYYFENDVTQTYLYELLNVCRSQNMFLYDIDGNPTCGDIIQTDDDSLNDCNDFSYRDETFCRVMGAGIGKKCKWLDEECHSAQCEDFEPKPNIGDPGPYDYIVNDCRYIGCPYEKNSCCSSTPKTINDNNFVGGFNDTGCSLTARTDNKYFRIPQSVKWDEPESIDLFIDNCFTVLQGFLVSDNVEDINCREFPDTSKSCEDFNASESYCLYMSKYSQKSDMQCHFEHGKCIPKKLKNDDENNVFLNLGNIIGDDEDNTQKKNAFNVSLFIMYSLATACFIMSLLVIFCIFFNINVFLGGKCTSKGKKKLKNKKSNITRSASMMSGIILPQAGPTNNKEDVEPYQNKHGHVLVEAIEIDPRWADIAFMDLK